MWTEHKDGTGERKWKALRLIQLILSSIGVLAIISVAVVVVLYMQKAKNVHINLQETEVKCQHGGVWDAKTSSCTGCEYKTFGTFCELNYEDCHDYWNKKIEEQNDEDVQVFIKPQASEQEFMVICRTSWGGQTIFASRERNSDENYNRGWEEYKSGFGDIGSDDFFIGLENLHNLLKIRDGRLKVFYHQVESDRNYHANYWQFKIDSEMKRYALHYDSFSGQNDAEDGFGFGIVNQTIRDAPFCTPDRDCGGCAGKSHSGWWFNAGCAKVNLHRPQEEAGYMQWPIDGSLADMQFYELIIYFDY